MADETIVIYRLGSLGDTVAALPCFHAIARRFPDSRRVVLTNAPVAANAAPLFSILGRETGIVHDAIAYPVGTRSINELLHLRRQLRALGATRMVYLMPSRRRAAAWRDWIYFKLSGFREIIAFPYADDMRQNRVDPASGVMEREAERLARCCAELGPIDLQARESWDLRLSDAERAVGHTIAAPLLSGPYVAVNMGGKVAKNDWGLDNWLALFRALGDLREELGVMVIGADLDSARADTFLAQWPGPKVNACGKLNPRESAAAMERADLFVGHDSGPLHLAVAAGVPSIGLFGDNNPPVKWHPIGDDVTVIHKMEGVMAITVDEVADVMRAKLGPKLAA